MTEGATIRLAKAPAKAQPTRDTQLRKLLARKSGVTLAQIQIAFGWQPHNSRAAISRLRKAGVAVERQDRPKGAVYHSAPTGGTQ